MLGGQDPAIRNKVKTWIHASEGTFMIHALAITYARWFAPKPFQDQPDQMKEFEKGLAINVCKDLDWLDDELKGRKFLAGEKLTAADTMVLMSVQFIFARDLCGGRKQSEWKEVDRWIGECEKTASWKKAVEKTGHEM
jgi:glutathione S-transferase